jgi:hypothetical protein
VWLDGVEPTAHALLADVAAGGKTLILRWNGTTWKRVLSPNPAGSSALDRVTATSAGNAWAVGTTGRKPLIVHWNGTAWKAVHSPSLRGTGELIGVTATSARNAWAVGNTGPVLAAAASPGTAWAADATGGHQVIKPKILILHWNGKAWMRVLSPSPAGGALLLGVTATSARDAWAVGD